MNYQYEEIIDYEEITQRQHDNLTQDQTLARRFLNISIASIQAGMSFLIEILPRTVVYLMLARINKPDLIASIGLGNIYMESLSQGVNIGISYGLEILISQAYGAKEFDLCGKIYYRSLFSATFFMLPIILLHLCSIYFYKIIIEDSVIIDYAYMYTIYMLLAVWLNAIYSQTKVFLNGQNIYNYQLYTQSVSCFVNVLLQYLFIIHLNLGLIGYVISQTLSEIFSLIVLISIIIITKCSQNVLVYFDVIDAILNSFKFFITAFPIGSVVWVEMICFQLYTLQAGYLSTKEFTTFIILLNVILISYSFSLGIGIAAATFVGNEMGRKNINEAKRVSYSSLIIDVVYQTSLIVLILLNKRLLSLMITDDEEIQFYIEDTLPFVCLIMLLDGLQVVLSSIVRAIGKAKYASHTFIICYVFIGNIVAFYLLHWKEFDAKGVWIGVSIGIVIIHYNISFYMIQYKLLTLRGTTGQIYQKISIKLQKIKRYDLLKFVKLIHLTILNLALFEKQIPTQTALILSIFIQFFQIQPRIFTIPCSKNSGNLITSGTKVNMNHKKLYTIFLLPMNTFDLFKYQFFIFFTVVIFYCFVDYLEFLSICHNIKWHHSDLSIFSQQQTEFNQSNPNNLFFFQQLVSQPFTYQTAQLIGHWINSQLNYLYFQTLHEQPQCEHYQQLTISSIRYFNS